MRCGIRCKFVTSAKFMTLAVFHVQKNMELDVDAYLRRRYEGQIANIQIVEKEDLDMVCVTKS